MEVNRIDSPLLRSQRRYRVHASGAVCREETSKKRRTGEHQGCDNKCQGIARTYVIQDFGQNAPCSEGKKKTCANCERCLHCALSHDEPKHVTLTCAQGHANTNFACPARHRISFYAINTDDG